MAKARPPVLGMLQRGGPGVSTLLATVQPKPSEPLRKDPRVPGTRVETDEASMEARVPSWGSSPKRVNHGRGALARDDDGDGWCAVPGNTMEGWWSLRRSWLRPHRGIAHEQRPVSLGCFACVHNGRTRGKALLPALIALLVT